ncbi:MAG: hypothetical protein AUJ49_03410 [Desulfovibrionaceae bacterium CG1_02_65_16]|nr:MAG: hypothetical protein AUJ49_03410 [Desulfovibrionaceae bacterium CG1_02_65_16]
MAKSESRPYAPAPGEVASEARRAGFKLTPAQTESLSRYLTLLLKWNRAMNLVGRAGWPDVFRDLAADSLHLAAFLPRLPLPAAPLSLDLGAGAGLPGIPLRVLWDAGDYVLVELREKRAVFLAQAAAALKLPRTRAWRGRAENALAGLAELGLGGCEADRRDADGRADLVLSRAFMPWPKLLPLAAELLAGGGVLVILANEAPPEAGEFASAGFTLADSQSYPSGARTRYFWALTKEPSTPPLKMSLVASSSA